MTRNASRNHKIGAVMVAGAGIAGMQVALDYDREEPKKIAWLQCVGSRDLQHGDNPHCSGVCCMYAIKEAVRCNLGTEYVCKDGPVFTLEKLSRLPNEY